jgi:hypothetical protein
MRWLSMYRAMYVQEHARVRMCMCVLHVSRVPSGPASRSSSGTWSSCGTSHRFGPICWRLGEGARSWKYEPSLLATAAAVFCRQTTPTRCFWHRLGSDTKQKSQSVITSGCSRHICISCIYPKGWDKDIRLHEKTFTHTSVGGFPYL